MLIEIAPSTSAAAVLSIFRATLIVITIKLNHCLINNEIKNNDIRKEETNTLGRNEPLEYTKRKCKTPQRCRLADKLVKAKRDRD